MTHSSKAIEIEDIEPRGFGFGAGGGSTEEVARRDMTNLERRIRKLEARGNDPSGLVPYSTRWIEYWDRQVERYLRGESDVVLTLEGLRSWMQRAGDECEA